MCLPSKLHYFLPQSSGTKLPKCGANIQVNEYRYNHHACPDSDVCMLTYFVKKKSRLEFTKLNYLEVVYFLYHYIGKHGQLFSVWFIYRGSHHKVRTKANSVREFFCPKANFCPRQIPSKGKFHPKANSVRRQILFEGKFRIKANSV